MPDGDKLLCSVSPSFQHPIRQLSAVLKDFSGYGQEDMIVAARTDYRVNFCNVLREDQESRFVSTAVVSFETHTSHVAWNPHIFGESAVILENGDVRVFDVDHTEYTDRHLSPKLTFSTSQSNELKSYCEDPFDGQATSQLWWQCEFGWHPKSVLVANSHSIFFVDMRENPSRSDFWCKSNNAVCEAGYASTVLAKVGGLQRSSVHCNTKPSSEQFLAFSRADYDGLYEFAAATKQHLMLYDCRKPLNPVLQWEHRMGHDPPGLLIMNPLSVLTPSILRTAEWDTSRGRAIVASSARSGDMAIFCYGTKMSVDYSSLVDEYKTKQSDWDDAIYAWQLPSRLCSAPSTVVDDWTSVLNSWQRVIPDNSHLTSSSTHRGAPESVCGLALMSGDVSLKGPSIDDEREAGFLLIVCTGFGDIIVQRYKPSKKLRGSPGRIERKTMGTLKTPESGREAYYELLPAFLNYMRTGSTKTVVISNAENNLHGGRIPSAWEDHSGEIGGILGKRTRLEYDTTSFHREVDKSYYQSILKNYLHKTSMPFSIYEVAHKVLRTGLPPNLQLFAAGMPSESRHRGQAVPILSSYLLADQEQHNPTTGMCAPDNSLAAVTEKRETVPLPFLFEVSCMRGSEYTPSKRAKRNLDQVETTTECSVHDGDLEMPRVIPEKRNEAHNLKFRNGHDSLQQGCSVLEDILKKLGVESEPSVVSLVDTDQWTGSSSEMDHKIHLLYTAGKDFSSNSGSTLGAGMAGNAKALVKSGRFGNDMFCSFVWAGLVSDECQPSGSTQFSIPDSEVCPVGLRFSKSEELEEDEWTALESLRSQLKLWQKSYAPYRTSFNSE